MTQYNPQKIRFKKMQARKPKRERERERDKIILTQFFFCHDIGGTRPPFVLQVYRDQLYF